MYAQPLSGGVAHRGQVFRVGDTVHRPLTPHRAGRHALLAHLDQAGFTGVPRVLSTDGDGEVLSWIAGRAARTPLPAWALSDASMLSVTRLVRDFHMATAPFDPSPYGWPDERVPDAFRNSFVSHNDLHPGNVVFDEAGSAVGLIDFDLAGPGSVAWDLAALSRCWCPLLADEDMPTAVAGRRLDRFAMLLDAYGLGADGRAAVAETILPNQEWTYRVVLAAVGAGHDGFRRYWHDVRGRVGRAHDWITHHQADLLAAAR